VACVKTHHRRGPFSDPRAETLLREAGVETTARPARLRAAHSLPDAENVISWLAGNSDRRGAESLTWAANTYLPALVAQRYRDSRIAAFRAQRLSRW